MKMSFFKNTAIVFMSAFTLSSCMNDDNNASFAPQTAGYILQEGSGDEMNFSLFVTVTSNYTDYLLADVSVMNTTTLNTLSMIRNNEYAFYSSESSYYSTPASLNGTYAVSAITTTGEAASTTFTISGYTDADTLGALELTNLTYNGSSLSMSFKEAKNAVYYGFILTPSENETYAKRVNNYYVSCTPTYDSEGVGTINYSFSSTGMSSQYLKVRGFAVSSNVIYIESDDCKTIKANGSSFLEDIDVD